MYNTRRVLVFVTTAFRHSWIVVSGLCFRILYFIKYSERDQSLCHERFLGWESEMRGG